MAYQSRIYQSQFKYDPFDDTKTDFNSKLGRVLNRGAYQGDLHQSRWFGSSLEGGNRSLPMAGGSKMGDGSVATHSSAAAPHRPCKEPALATLPPTNWVGSTGARLPVERTGVQGASANQQPATGGSQESQPRQLAQHMGKTYHEQVMELWKRINPGVMPMYAGTPPSTMQDHFKWQPADVEPVNSRAHLRKTDFSEYTEVAAKFMKGLITDKASPKR